MLSHDELAAKVIACAKQGLDAKAIVSELSRELESIYPTPPDWAVTPFSGSHLRTVQAILRYAEKVK